MQRLGTRAAAHLAACHSFAGPVWVAVIGLLLAGLPASAQPTRLSIMGDTPTNGIFDPSVEYAPDSAVGWLSYSAVYGSLQPWGPHVETRLARSTDAGATWSFSGVVNASRPAVLQLPDGSTLEGVWNHEVSSLVHDPDDPGAEWKLFSHRIFRRAEDDFTGEQNLPAWSWIAFRSAPDPTGPWSPEIALLSSGPLPPAPYDDVRVAIDALHPSLASLSVYSEPGAFYRGGVLYLSLTGLTGSGPDRIVLLASDDHGASWRYVGTPLANADAPPLGFLSFDGSAIAEQNGRVFLLATPQSPTVTHDGTLVFEFEDLASGTLLRDAGIPVIAGHIAPIPGLPASRRGGQADFHQRNTAGGVLIPALQMGDLPELFQVYATGQPLVGSVRVPAVAAWQLGVCGLAVLALHRWRAAPKRRSRRSPGGPALPLHSATRGGPQRLPSPARVA